LARRDQYLEKAEPIKIGLLLDNPQRSTDSAERIYDLVVDNYARSKRFERGFEFVKVYPYGPPAGFIQNAIDGFHDLCDQGCIAVVGGHHADDCIALAPHADARKVPLLNTGATTHAMSTYSFSISWGSIPHDVYTVASWLKRKSYKRVVITYDRAEHILENVVHFRNACARSGIKILSEVRFPQSITDDLQERFAEAHRDLAPLNADALAHFGSGAMSYQWAEFVNKNWGLPRIMNDAFHGANNAWATHQFEGWVGTTMWDDDNEVNNRFFEQYNARYPDQPVASREILGVFHDLMTALVEGVMLAPTLTPDGVRRGLEMVQMVPAACGGPRSYIAFSPHAHRGLQGPDIMVLRRVEEGRLIMEGHIELC